jgi:hypothetical protein
MHIDDQVFQQVRGWPDNHCWTHVEDQVHQDVAYVTASMFRQRVLTEHPIYSFTWMQFEQNHMHVDT